MSKKLSSISVFALAMLITGAVDGVGNLPSIAIFGTQLIFFFVFASIVFLLPTGLISAELCKQFPNEGGVYNWAKKAFGDSYAMLVVWLQWVNTIIFFPTCLTGLAGTLAYLINPNLANKPVFLVCISLSAFWIMTFVNLKGIKQSAKITSITTIVGMVVPMILIISLSLLWIVLGKPLAVHITKASVLPNLADKSTWVSLTAIITAFLGMELAAVHVKKIKNADKIFPKALVVSIIIIILTMGLGSLGVSLIVPHKGIILVSGTIQAFHTIFAGFHVLWLSYVIGVMLLFASVGTMVNWLISPAQGLAQALSDSKNKHLNKFAKENKNGVPSKILIAQAVCVSLISCVFFIMPSVNGSYWFLIDLSTELYIAMYILMFISAIKLSKQFNNIFIVPFGSKGYLVTCLLGLIGCVIAFIVGFIPPSNINIGGVMSFEIKFIMGLLIAISPIILFKFIWKKIN